MVLMGMGGCLALLYLVHWRAWALFFAAASALGLPQIYWVTPEVRDEGFEHLRPVAVAALEAPGQVTEYPLAEQVGDPDGRGRREVRIGDMREREHPRP
jgi:hypothetical protein